MKTLNPEHLNLCPPAGCGFIYMIEAQTGKRYIGKTITSIGKRFRRHCRANRSHECPAIWRTIQKYGPLDMRVYMLGVYPRSALDQHEKEAIASFNTAAPNGYNLTEGGDGGRVVSVEARRKMGDARRGAHCSEPHKRAISLAHTGKTLSDETRAKISAAAKRRKLSEETKRKIGESGKARKWRPSPEHLAKMIAARHPK